MAADIEPMNLVLPPLQKRSPLSESVFALYRVYFDNLDYFSYNYRNYYHEYEEK